MNSQISPWLLPSIAGSLLIIFISATKDIFYLRAGKNFPAAMAAHCRSFWLIGLILFPRRATAKVGSILASDIMEARGTNKRSVAARLILATILSGLLSCRAAPDPVDAISAPVWLKMTIRQYKASVVEQSEYRGATVFHVIRGDRAADAGDEHRVYSADGVFICSFGGYEGRLAQGSCDVDHVNYVRTIYERKR